MDRTAGPKVLCIGELLWDVLPGGLSLGGAPFNVARHLCSLGVRAEMASRVGVDRPGTAALQAVAQCGLGTDLVQVDPIRPTGKVRVSLDPHGNPEYDIVEPAAWDAIELTQALTDRAARADAIVFGSLAQRSPITRATIQRLLERSSLKVFDVNLRAPYVDRDRIRQSLGNADIVKLNDEELRQLAQWWGLATGLERQAHALAREFGCSMVCVTRGAAGAALLHDGTWTEHAGYQVEVTDTVGAGDAFLAAVLASRFEGRDDLALLEHGNLLGAFVATQAGAVPPFDRAAIERIRADARPN